MHSFMKFVRMILYIQVVLPKTFLWFPLELKNIKLEVMTWNERLSRYDEIVLKCPRFERKGKTVPYTSANGHMFSLLNKEGELGFRFSKTVQEKYIKDWDAGYLISHNATMKGYVRIPEEMFSDLEQLAAYLNESFDYVMSLDPK